MLNYIRVQVHEAFPFRSYYVIRVYYTPNAWLAYQRMVPLSN